MATDIVPARVVNLHRTRWLLLLASALAAILGSILLIYTLAVGARLRTRQLAILRALGMTRRRVGRVLASQGIVLALAMCLIGIPVGVAAGSIAWRVIAHQLGVGEVPVISPAIALLVPIAVGVGLGAAIVPGRRVRRDDVGRLLHAE
jgi:putative ABC transport system permease protein